MTRLHGWRGRSFFAAFFAALAFAAWLSWGTQTLAQQEPIAPAATLEDVIVIAQSSTVPVLDGSCSTSASEYADAAFVPFATSGGQIVVYTKHSATDMYVCMTGLAIPVPAQRDGPNAAVYIHRRSEGPTAPDYDTFVLSISYLGTVRAAFGGRTGYTPFTIMDHFAAAKQNDSEIPQWSAEFRIGAPRIGGGWEQNVRIGFAQQWVNFTGDDYVWPAGFAYANPSTWAVGQLTRAATGATLDIRPLGMEVTQSIQSNMPPGVPLVAGRRTFVRVAIVGSTENSRRLPTTARLYGRRGTTPLGVLLPLNAGGRVLVRRAISRGVLSDAFLFELPNTWVVAGGPLTLWVDINPFRNPPESNYTNNRLGPLNFPIVTTQPLKLLLRNIEYTPGSNLNTTVQARQFDLDMLDSWLRRAYPISQLDDVRRTLAYIGPSPLTRNIFGAADFVNGLLAANRVTEGDRRRIQVGMVTDAGGFMRGLTPWNIGDVTATPTGSFNSSWAWDTDGSWGDWYGGHEIGHVLGRPHAFQRIGSNGCGVDWFFFQEEYPYNGVQIGGNGGESEPLYYGFDGGDAGLNVPMSVVPPWWTDVMSYCANQWVSDFTYARLRTEINARASAVAAEESAPIPGDFLVLYATIDFAQQSATVRVLRREPSVTEIPERIPGAYAIRLLDDAGASLAIYAATPYTSSENINKGTLFEVVPFMPGTRRIAITSSQSNQSLTEISVSPNAPVVTNVVQHGGASLAAGGPVTVTWSANDADGDALHFSIKYSADGQTTWRMLVDGIAETHYTLDAAELEGTHGALSGYLRVVANDGVNSGFGVSEKFAVAGKSPALRIANPADGARYGYGQTVAFEAVAQDFEDGTLTDGAIAWTSSIDGALGNGVLLHDGLLSPGTHTITAIATDADGDTASVGIEVVIEEDVEATAVSENTLALAPNNLMFLAPVTATVVPAQPLSIRNLAPAPLAWQAQASAPWIILEQQSGTDETDIVVSVETEGMLPGSIRTGTITVTAAGAASSPALVHVTLQMQGPHPDRSENYRVLLPTVQ